MRININYLLDEKSVDWIKDVNSEILKRTKDLDDYLASIKEVPNAILGNLCISMTGDHGTALCGSIKPK